MSNILPAEVLRVLVSIHFVQVVGFEVPNDFIERDRAVAIPVIFGMITNISAKSGQADAWIKNVTSGMVEGDIDPWSCVLRRRPCHGLSFKPSLDDLGGDCGLTCPC